jgi:hypothetical protein
MFTRGRQTKGKWGWQVPSPALLLVTDFGPSQEIGAHCCGEREQRLVSASLAKEKTIRLDNICIFILFVHFPGNLTTIICNNRVYSSGHTSDYQPLIINKYEGVSRSFRTGRLERELQMVQLSATRCSCIAILWVILESFAAITLCVASQRVIPTVSIYFVIGPVRKILDTLSYTTAASI